MHIPKNEIKVIQKDLDNIGICETQLPKDIINDFWDLIEDAKKSPKDMRDELAGNITSSLVLNVKSPQLKDFASDVLSSLINTYLKVYKLPWRTSLKEKFEWNLSNIWVNFQRQNEFNPIHDHAGVFSFVIWMKIPTSYKEQRELPFVKASNSDGAVSNFGFIYHDILGDLSTYYYPMEKDMEGYLVFFPSRLKHLVNPFYNCDDERITISGNIDLV